MRKYLLILLPALMLLGLESNGQKTGDTLSGHIFEQGIAGDTVAVFGAIICWEGAKVCAQSDLEGYFEIPRVAETSVLTIKYFGYRPTEVDAEQDEHLDFVLSAEAMKPVEIRRRRKSTEVNFTDPIKVEILGERELTKAACCNLSESFETSPSVDVSFTDAVTGTRQIRMLGLDGPYSQITRESVPDIRGLSAITGFTYVPGSWIESIQLNKGTGSVVNGFESIAGQINYELRKPEESERLYVNLYANEGGRIEGNVHLAHRFDEKLSTGILMHGWYNNTRLDRNGDGFLDNLNGNNGIILNRWKYKGDNGVRAQIGVKYTSIDRVGGEMAFDREANAGGNTVWGLDMSTRRLDAWAKLGGIYQNKPWKSTGSQYAVTVMDMNNWFGQRKYNATQRSGYFNFIHQSIFGTTDHEFKTGASLLYDEYRENFNDSIWNRQEIVPGAYFEYTYKYLDKFAAVAGLRADYHNIYGMFFTPRLHLRYEVSESLVIRASGGRGQRTASVFAENIGAMASNRQFVVRQVNSDNPYGLNPEVAWNYGFNIAKCFEAGFREGTITLDVYRTDFINQIVVDYDADPQQLRIYNLDGRSFSNSIQAQFDMEIFKRFDARVAYRWYDVRTDYDKGFRRKPLMSVHRAFLNLAYEAPRKWMFDATINWTGPQRIPDTDTNPVQYQLATESPSFFRVNSQISKTWREMFEVYLGVENLLNYRQPNPILSADQPFGQNFDASLVWGPVFGRMTYAGLRLKIK